MSNDLEIITHKIKSLIQKFGEQKDSQYDLITCYSQCAESSEKLTSQEMSGLCSGFSTYYLYQKVYGRSNQMFERFNTILDKRDNILDETPLRDFRKDIKQIRTMARPEKMDQNDVAKIINSIKSENEELMTNEFQFIFAGNREKFNDLFQGLFSEPRLIILTTNIHVMGLFVQNENNIFLMESNYTCRDELQFSNWDDLYTWLVYESASYNLDNSEHLLTSSLILGVTIARFENAPALQYSKDLKLITSFEFINHISNINDLLFISCIMKQKEVIDYLLTFPEFKEIINYQEPVLGNTPLIYCVSKGYFDIVETLLKNGTDTNIREFRDFTPLHIALHNNYPKIVTLLIKYEADLVKRASPGIAESYFEIFNKYPEEETYLLDAINNFELFKMLYSQYEDKYPALLEKNCFELLKKSISMQSEECLYFLLEKSIIDFLPRNEKKIIFSEIFNSNIAKIDTAKPCFFKIFSEEQYAEIIASCRILNNFQFIMIDYNLLEMNLLDKLLNQTLNYCNLTVSNYLIDNHSLKCNSEYVLDLVSNYKIFTKNEDSLSKILVPRFNTLFNVLNKTEINIISCNSNGESLATWALENQDEMPIAEGQECINFILEILNNDPVLFFGAKSAIKAKELAQILDRECQNLRNTTKKSNLFIAPWHKYRLTIIENKLNSIYQLIKEITTNPTKPIMEIMEIIFLKNPSFLSGTFMHRELDLVKYIENIQNDILSNNIIFIK